MEDFAKAKKDIKKFLEDKLLPGQSLLSQFGEDLKRDKRKFEESINICEESLEEEHENAKELLLASKNWYVRTAAQKVFKPNDPSDLELALKYKRIMEQKKIEKRSKKL